MGLFKDKDINKTEFTKIRESYNFTKKEVADEIGISEPVYSLKERDARKASQQGKEKFFYQLCHACETIYNRKKQKSDSLALNSYIQEKVFNTEEEAIEDECEMELHYQPITKKHYKKMERQIIGGKTVIQVAVREGVDDRELGSLLKQAGVDYVYDTGYEKTLLN